MNVDELEQAILSGQEDTAIGAIRLLVPTKDMVLPKCKSSLLGLAAERGMVKLVAALLAKGVSPDEGGEAESPLRRALAARQEDAAKLLVGRGASIMQAAGKAPVFSYLAGTAKLVSRKTLSYLLSKAAANGADVNEQDLLGTALHHILRDELSWLVETLCHLGADPNRGNSRGISPLDFYVMLHRPRLIEAITRCGAQVDRISPFTGITPLYASCISNVNFSCVSRLLQAGADPNMTSDDWPLIHLVVSDGDVALARMLHQYGADINRAERKRGLTPLMVATRLGRVDAVEFLLAQGADKWVRDAVGCMPKDFIEEVEDYETRVRLTDLLGYS